MISKSHTSSYYDALINSYLNEIFQSGLLLDEDLQILIDNYKPEVFPCDIPQHRPTLALKLSALTVFGGLILTKRFSYWILVPPLAVTALAAVLELRTNIKIRKEKKLMAKVIHVSKKINSLNDAMKKYMKTRVEIKNKSQNEFFVSYNKKIEKFFKSVLSSEIHFFETFIKTIETIVYFSNELKDDFESVRTFQPLKIEQTQFNKLEAGLEFLSQIQDLHIWMTSKLLSYMSIAFLKPNEKFDKKELEKLLHSVYPAYLAYVCGHYEEVRKLFFALRNSETKLHELRQQKRNPHLSNKLSNTLITAIDNISIISEKSQSVLTELEQINGASSKTIETCLVDLRNHTYAAYESLDLLCRLYGILLSKESTTNQPITSTKKSQIKEESNVCDIHHDDNIVSAEENYELYLEKDYEPPAEDAKTYKEENSSAYLGLMLQELRQSLKKHERFVEAKRRRGSVDIEEVVKEEEVLPKFNVDVLKTKKLRTVDEVTKNENMDKDPDIHTKSLLSSPIPPAPPPLPDFNLEQLSELRCNSMLVGIRTLSSQLNMQEEVFGKSDEEDDE